MEKPWLKHYEKGVPQNIEDPKITLPDMLQESVEKFSENPVMTLFKTEVSYRELDELSTNFAKNLLEFGVEKGDRVAIMAPNSPEFVIAFYGTLKAGGVAVPVNSLYGGEDVAYILENSGAKIFVVLDLFYDQIEGFLLEIELEQVLKTDIKQYLSLGKKLEKLKKDPKQVAKTYIKRIKRKIKGELAVKFQEWIEETNLETHLPKVNPEDLALLLYTSGTTSKPKGAMLTHKNLVANTIQCTTWVKNIIQEGKDRILTVLPFFHGFGLTSCMNTSIRIGATMVLLPKFTTEDAASALSHQGVTIFPGVPAMYVALNGRCAEGIISFQKETLALKACISGADTLLSEVQEKFEKYTGITPIEGFGQTETSPVTHIHPINPVDGKVRIGSIGLPVSGTSAKIIDLETREELGPNKEGELIVSGPQVMKGYWQNPEETAKVLKNGWFYTGDIAKIDQDGYFYIVSRVNDMIKFKGEKVFPKEVENVLLQHPKIEEVVVVGVPYKDFQEVVVAACIVLKSGEKITKEEVIAFCEKKKLAEYKMPKIIEFRQMLPKNFMQRVDRRKLKETLAQKYG